MVWLVALMGTSGLHCWWPHPKQHRCVCVCECLGGGDWGWGGGWWGCMVGRGAGVFRGGGVGVSAEGVHVLMHAY